MIRHISKDLEDFYDEKNLMKNRLKVNIVMCV